MRAGLVFSLCLAVLGASCARKPDQREYTLQGQVLSVTPNRQQATISHEEIKGLMSAMTMPYAVHDPKQLEGIAPGDLINAKLVVLTSDAYLTDVKRVGQAPLPQAPSEAAPAASSGFELLRPGEAVPDAAFVDQDGRKRRFSSFKGSTVLITFIYTRCPMPTFCPLMDQHFVTIQKKLKDDEPAIKGRVHLVSVSFDPLVDTPPVLKAHAQRLGADLKGWTFLTGDRDDIDRFASRFGVSVARAPNDQRDITHNLRTAIVDADGKLAKVYVGNEWTPDQALADLKPVAR
jgi:protein SCO1/2